MTPYYTVDGDAFIPTDIARGPWGATISGNILGGLLGVHLHDMVGARDHQIPGTGELDLAEVARRLAGRRCIRVLELGTSFVPEAIVAGRRHLESLGF